MATCKKCLHIDICNKLRPIECCLDKTCSHFQNKSNYAEVKRGEWIETNDDNKKRCSNCDIIHLIAQYPNGQTNYCPNCGTKMKAEKFEVL